MHCIRLLIQVHRVSGWVREYALLRCVVNESIFRVSTRSWIVFKYDFRSPIGTPRANRSQYAYLSHFYANALSIFLDDTVAEADISAEHFEALRNLPSFQQ